MHYLVAYRDPESGAASLRTAQRLARAGDEVTVIHVFEAHDAPWGLGTAEFVEATEQLMDEREANVAGTLAEVGLEANIVVDVADPGEGTARRIAREASERGSEMVIVVSKRASGVLGLLLGSVAQGLLEVSPAPVLVIRPSGSEADPRR